jgi:hypothetical protein
MADVIRSRQAKGAKLAKDLARLTNAINQDCKKEISSPLTITLGDEFQGVVHSAKAGLKIMVMLEEMIVEKGIEVKLRYVLGSGKIDTPINKRIAHGMIGGGLTKTRESLQTLKKSDQRFLIAIGENDKVLNRYFILYQSFVDDWKLKDFKIISDFLKNDDYKTVADRNNKTWSQMWKRRKSLKIKEYKTVCRLILE